VIPVETEHEAGQQFLRDAARGHRPFVDHVAALLVVSDLGECFTLPGTRQRLAQVLAATAEVGAAAALAYQSLELGDLGRDERARVSAAVSSAARRAAQAHEVLSGVLGGLEESAEC
jgi:hypothetical protein